MTTAVNYAVNYAGDFTTIASAFAGIGTNLTASSSGHTLQSGSTTTVIVLSASEGSNDYTGHPLTVGGTTCLITSYNTSTKTATVSARAGYGAAFGSAPSSGTAYAIADVSVTLTIGQSASGNNLWTSSTALTLPAITTGASNGITLQGATAWSFTKPMRCNTAGATSAPVCIQSTNALFTITPNYVTINDLCFDNVANSAVTASGTNCTANRCFFQCDNNSSSDYAFTGSAATTVANNCTFYGTSASSRPAVLNGTAAALNDCLVYTVGDYPILGATVTCTDCAFYGFTGSPVYTGSGSSGSAGISFVRCAAPSNITSTTGITVIALTGLFLSASSPVDFRPAPSSGLLAAGGAPAVSTDMYGVTRSVSASTIGPSEAAFSPPALTTVTYNFAYNGDFTDIAPNGTMASLSWSGGVATGTTSAAHGLPVGMTIPINLQNLANTATGYYPQTSPMGYSVVQATITGSTTFTWPVASNPGTAPSGTLWHAQIPNGFMGTDLTYYESGGTCPSTAADASHIVLDSNATSACIGHPIQWTHNSTTTTALIIAFNSGTGVAQIGAYAGYPATFALTPASGDSYTIFPIAVAFNIGQSSAGNTLWQKNVYFNNAGVLNFGPGVTTSAASTITVNGTASYSRSVALGTIASSGSAIGIQCGVAADVTSDHTAVIGFGVGNLTISNLQLWDAGTTNPDGALLQTADLHAPVTINKCVLRSDGGTSDEQHSPFLGQSNFTNYSTITFTNCVMVSENFNTSIQLQSAGVVLNHCTVAYTGNAITTTVGDTPSGSTTITLASTTGVISAGGAATGGSFVACPSIPGAIPTWAIVKSISGSTVTLEINTNLGSGSAATLADIPSGTTLVFGVGMGTSGQTCSAENTAFFGMQYPYQPAYSFNATTCATDSNPASHSGFTILSYPAQFTAASGTLGSGVDLRPKAGNGLQIGTYMSGVSTDIYGAARANPPTIGAVEYKISTSFAMFTFA